MRLRGIAVGLGLILAGIAAPCVAAGRPRVVQQAMTFQSGGKVIDVAVFRPADDGKHPTIVYLHGGGFSFEDPVMVRFNTELAMRGLVVLAPHYLLNRTGWPHWQKTATDAVTFALTLPGVDADRVGMSGISMGGQVVLSAAARDRRVKAVAEFFTAWPGSLPDEPIADLPPVLLLNGTADPIIPLDAAFELDGLLQARGMPHERQVYHGLGHGFGDGPAFHDAVLRTAAFFGGRVEGPEPGPVPAEAVSRYDVPSGSLVWFLELDDQEFAGASAGTTSAFLAPARKKRRRPIVANPIAPRSDVFHRGRGF